MFGATQSGESGKMIPLWQKYLMTYTSKAIELVEGSSQNGKKGILLVNDLSDHKIHFILLSV